MVTAATDLQAERDQLPASLVWTYEHERRQLAVTLGLGHCWPGILVVIDDHAAGLRTGAQFDSRGHVCSFAIEATSAEADVTTAVLRRPMLATMRSWHRVAREVGRQILAGVPERSIRFDGTDATSAMRELLFAAGRARPPQRRRGTRLDDLIAAVADAYRGCVAAGDPHPRVTIAEAFGLSHAHIGRLLGAARKPRNGEPALLGPALRGRAGEAEPGPEGH